MKDTVVILVNGEVLASERRTTIESQFLNAKKLAEGLQPLFCRDFNVAVLHGNKPQVGFVLFRSELASHILHPIPLDVCGADTQGATGYMMTQAFMNVLHNHNINRPVIGVLTQTVVDSSHPLFHQPTKAIGPRFDRDKAEQHRQTRGWHIIQEPGLGYRRAVPAPPPIKIIGVESVKQLVEAGVVVVTAGGGGVPVIRTETGQLQGVEAVVDTDQVAYMVAKELKAKVLLMIIEKDKKFLLSRLSTEANTHLSIAELDQILAKDNDIQFNTVRGKLQAAANFLYNGGEQVVITTLRNLPLTLKKESGLWIGESTFAVDLTGNC